MSELTRSERLALLKCEIAEGLAEDAQDDRESGMSNPWDEGKSLRGQFYMSDPVRAKLREAMMNVSPLKEDPMTSEEQLGTPDWTKAPDWAYGYGLAGPVQKPVWVGSTRYRHVDGSQSHRAFSFADKIGFAPEDIKIIAYHLKSRVPIEWDGTGCPPVGTKCEVLDHDHNKWLEIEVTAIARNHLVAIFNGEESLLKKNCDFRPLPTKGMREREEAVGAALQTIQRKVTPAEHTLLSGFAMRLHDAGMLIKAAE